VEAEALAASVVVRLGAEVLAAAGNSRTVIGKTK